MAEEAAGTGSRSSGIEAEEKRGNFPAQSTCETVASRLLIPSLKPRGVMVAQQILVLFVKVRILPRLPLRSLKVSELEQKKAFCELAEGRSKMIKSVHFVG